ncbi:iron complex transport system permease protein [Kytococcus aerolatus]|uniref:Iron complex transport system permease protein n=1 Tax=Kytococcus aerolatus TaxID=592308 RepID=A0A212TZH4_9MICO|nr:iron chelate uptake ABC transporter family permease subunit [Kytococcus aerolatus]SNC71405.1 iron complex transport system permease protein [Kytococcus aerolatus]
MSAEVSTLSRVRTARIGRLRRWWAQVVLLAAILVGLVVLTLTRGDTNYSLAEVWRVIRGVDAGGADFIVGTLRLPRVVLAVVAGAAFGLAGTTFQTLLRNPLASPDVVGITAGASAAASVGIVSLGWSDTQVSLLAVTAGMAVALGVYLLAWRGGLHGTRLVLIGIGVAAMLQSVVAIQLEEAGRGQLAEALRWLTGSLNGATWQVTTPPTIAVVVLGAVLLSRTREIGVGQLGDDAANALGVRVDRSRLVTIMVAVTLICIATAATGPIAFVAFLAGPITARLMGNSGSLLLPAALTGAVLVVGADWVGQNLLPHRYPVGVVTGVLGAPYLLYLIVRVNRTGGHL